MQWIDVNDRLPEKSDYYLVCYLCKFRKKHKIGFLKFFRQPSQSWNPDKRTIKMRWSSSIKISKKDIKYWMESPKLPEGLCN